MPKRWWLLLMLFPGVYGGPDGKQAADWIWPGRAKQGEVAFFRRTLELPDGAVESARLRIACDNIFELYVNGKHVARGQSWERPLTLDIKDKLKPGPNVFAVRGQNQGGPAALALALEAISQGRAITRLTTDKEWKCTRYEIAGWQEPEFDDSGWTHPMVFGKMGVAPWGDTFAGRPGNVTRGHTTSFKPLPAEESLKHFVLPPGFQVQLVAAEPMVINPMTLCLDEAGHLFISESHTYRYGKDRSPVKKPSNPICMLALGPDGRAVTSTIVADGFPEPVMGLAAYRGKLFVTCLNRLYVYSVTPGGKLANRKLLVSDKAKPWNPFGMFRVYVGRDGRLWFSIGTHRIELTGSDGRVIRPHGSGGAIFRCDRDGSHLEVLAEGLRVPFSFDVDVFGQLWSIANGQGSPNRYFHAIYGADYGFGTRTRDWDWLAGKRLLSPPVLELPPGAYTGVLQYNSSAFPAKYLGQTLIANWGSHGAAPRNRDLTPFLQLAQGTAKADEVFLSSSDPMFRPTEIKLGPDGTVLVLDWYGRDDESDLTGRVYRILPEGNAPSQKLPTLDQMKAAGAQELVGFLGHPNHQVRRVASERLADKSRKGSAGLGQTIRGGEPLRAAEAVWVLAKTRTPEAANAIGSALQHPDPRVRGLALRLLRDASGHGIGRGPSGLKKGDTVTPVLLEPQKLAAWSKPLLQDSDPEVRLEAARALLNPSDREKALVLFLQKATDRRLRFQAAMDLVSTGSIHALVALWSNSAKPSRAGALLVADLAMLGKTPLAADVQEWFEEQVERLEPTTAPLLLELVESSGGKGMASAIEKFLTREDLNADLFAQGFRVLQKLGGEVNTSAIADAFVRALRTGKLAVRDDNERIQALTIIASAEFEKPPVMFLADAVQSRNPAVREAAHRAIDAQRPKSPELAQVLLTMALHDPNPEVRLAAIFSLGAIRQKMKPGDWLALVRDPSEEINFAALRAARRFGKQKALLEALEQEAQALKKGSPALFEELRFTLVTTGVLKPGQTVSSIDKAAIRNAVLSRLPKASRPLGRIAFFKSKAACFRCHTIRGQGGKFGPVLDNIGKAVQPDYLVDSVLLPSKVIKSGYETVRVETRDGRTLQGMVEKKEHHLVIKQSEREDEQFTVPLSEVKKQTVVTISPMPEDLEKGLSIPEFADIVAYLSSLGREFAALKPAETEEGFRRLFNGKDLDGWDGNPKFWRVEKGTITGETTAKNPTSGNTFLFWRRGILADFELRLSFKLRNHNSGIQYRARDFGNWVAGGYQADMDAANQYTGMMYEERGRGLVTRPGQKVILRADGRAEVIDNLAKPGDIAAKIRKDDWNEYTIIARGNQLMQLVNGQVAVQVIDENREKRALSGLLAFQIHQGPPMKVQFKNIRLKVLR